MISFREELSLPGIGFFTNKLLNRFLRIRKLAQYQFCYNNVKHSGEFHLRDDRKRTNVKKFESKRSLCSVRGCEIGGGGEITVMNGTCEITINNIFNSINWKIISQS